MRWTEPWWLSHDWRYLNKHKYKHLDAWMDIICTEVNGVLIKLINNFNYRQGVGIVLRYLLDFLNVQL